VISSPSNYRDVQQELITEIHQTAIWPVVVTGDGNISKPEKTDFTNRYGSYIILIPDGNLETFQVQINFQHKTTYILECNLMLKIIYILDQMYVI
jgi:hypothetical protein